MKHGAGQDARVTEVDDKVEVRKKKDKFFYSVTDYVAAQSQSSLSFLCAWTRPGIAEFSL